ncbi:hypothetical protein [Methanoregula sp.]|uniref:hypothetical protein n=1 Tax=Methanoregula sp. TaxID=2052170 RepID=UPI0025F316C8|nr:hypothetical protein [Methanoregula sp.]
MPRGRRPLAAIADAQQFAEKMGYQWQENTDHPDLGYDLFVFKPSNAFLLRVRVLRNHISAEDFYEDLLKDELAEVRSLPFPKWMPREIWLRTQHERTFRRLRIYDVAVGEIGFWEPDGYVNKHARD